MVVGDSLKSHVWTVDKHDVIMAHLEKLFPTLVLACTVYSGVTALFSFLEVSFSLFPLFTPFFFQFEPKLIVLVEWKGQRLYRYNG